MVNCDQTTNSHSSYSLPMSPEKYYQDLYQRLLELTGCPSAKTLQRIREENDLGRELGMRGNKVSFRPSSHEESNLKMDS